MPIHSTPNRWILETDHNAYAFGLDPDGRLVNTYWGERLLHFEDYPENDIQHFWSSFNDLGQMAREEYPAESGLKYIEPCFKALYPDGVRDTVLWFDKVVQDNDVLQIHLRDALEPLQIVLHYRLHERYDLIERWAEITNSGRHIRFIIIYWNTHTYMVIYFTPFITGFNHVSANVLKTTKKRGSE